MKLGLMRKAMKRCFNSSLGLQSTENSQEVTSKCRMANVYSLMMEEMRKKIKSVKMKAAATKVRVMKAQKKKRVK